METTRKQESPTLCRFRQFHLFASSFIGLTLQLCQCGLLRQNQDFETQRSINCWVPEENPGLGLLAGCLCSWYIAPNRKELSGNYFLGDY